MKWTTKHLAVTGVALIALTNAVVLAGVAYNRSGAPESTLKLTARELDASRPGGGRENSSLVARMRWRVLPEERARDGFWYRYGGAYQGSPAWLDNAKMASLGFNVALPDTEIETKRSFKRELPRDVLLVLELDGAAYQESLRGVELAAAKLRRNNKPESAKLADEIVPLERDHNSRLFVVDAGRDAAALRSKYPDRSRYAIVHGQVSPGGRFVSGEGRHTGYVAGVDVDSLNVPLELRAAFEGAVSDRAVALMNPPSRLGRHEAEVAFGKRLEPWLVSASRNEAAPTVQDRRSESAIPAKAVSRAQ
jgi:hypothetical protein